MREESEWTSWAARAYYFIAAPYYALKWFELGFGGVASAIALALSRVGLSTAPLVLCGVSIMSLGLYAIRSERHRRARFRSANHNMKILRREYTYVIMGNRRYSDRTWMKVRALVDGVDHFVFRFAWSSSGDPTITVREPVGTVVTISNEETTYFRRARLQFERALRAGEELGIDIVMESHDVAGTLRPYYEASCTEWDPTPMLMKVCFPIDSTGTYRKEMRAARGAEVALQQRRGSVGPHGSLEVSWEIKPRPHFSYAITWEVENGSAPASVMPSRS